MTGGLLQLATSGQEDAYLTINPQITFFKKVFYRHTQFATELQVIYPDQQPEFNSNITFTITNMGDALHRCYLEIDLPNISFTDASITDINYINIKNNINSRIQENIAKFTDLYTNLKKYTDTIIILYRQLKSILLINNITTTNLQNIVSSFMQQNKLINDIDITILATINIPEYIFNKTELIGVNITAQTIINNLDTMYNNMIYWLKYYFNMVQYYKRQLNNTNINFNWADYLGHNFFNYFKLDIGGVEITTYDNQYLHIQQLHKIKEEYLNNYFKMIGHTSELNEYNNKPKGGNKIIVPLLFWFCKDVGSSLPLIAMQYQTVTISANINNINKIICFENWGKMYDDLLIVNEFYDYNNVKLNLELSYSSYNIDFDNKIITYHSNIINKALLENKYPNLTEEDINNILSYGVNNEINRNQWIHFMNNINYELSTKMELYVQFIDYNLLYSQINVPNISLLAEYIYFDEVERGKFVTSKLEYIMENVNTDIYNINDEPMFNCELSFTKPVKELYWYVQPNIFTNMLSKYGQNMDLLLTSKNYLPNIINNNSLKLDQYEVLVGKSNQNYINMLSYKYLNNSLPEGVFYHTFSLYPEETQPSGIANMSIIKSKLFNCNFNPDFIHEYYENSNTNNLNLNHSGITLKFYAKSYNVFVVEKGRAELLFSV
jgi:hypothetical protein